MRELFAFIYRFRGFLVFALLQALCIFLIVTNNPYQSSAFFSSANNYTGKVLAFETEVEDYFRLSRINVDLAEENAFLRQQLQQYRQINDSIPANAIIPDSLPLAGVLFMPAKVINNSVRRVNNFITLDVGRRHGISPGMGVITKDGVVGRVKAVSANFATVTSLLHSKWVVSAKLKKDNTLGSINWDGIRYDQVILNFIPLHVKVQRGDTVVTSGYTGVFPDGVLVGLVEEVLTENDKNFYTIKVGLSVDFARLSYVYVLKDRLFKEQDSLEVTTTGKESLR